MAIQLKIMSFNLRCDVVSDGINYFFNRIDRVLEILDKEKTDIVGFQEVTDSMRAKLRDSLTDYMVQGCGRERNYRGESMIIAYRKDVMELISLENIWLSMTPSIPGTSYGVDQSGNCRMFTAALLKHKDSDKPFRMINTHLDHEGKTARYLGAVQLVQYISVHPEPFILTGDFNATPETPEIQVIPEALAYRGGKDCTADLPGTFHWFGKIPEDKRPKIDYIFSDAPCVKSYMVEDVPVDGVYYSDHNAVCAVLEME